MKQNILKYGIIAGVALIGYFLLFYNLSKEMMLGQVGQLSSYLIYIAFMFIATKQAGDLDFKGLLRTAFAVFLIMNAFYYVFDYVLFNFKDKSLINTQKDLMLEYWQKGTKTVEEQNLVTQAIQNGDFHTPQALLFAFAKGSIGGFGLSILVAYLIKRNN